MMDVWEIITTVVGFTVAGLIMMGIGFFTIKYFVRMIMTEMFTILKQRVLDDAGDEELKKHRKGFTRKP